jgi:hypothetical protein
MPTFHAEVFIEEVFIDINFPKLYRKLTRRVGISHLSYPGKKGIVITAFHVKRE